MNDIVTVNDTTLYAKEVNGIRVVTFNDIDALHNRPKGTAKRNFSQNKRHFIEQEDYYILRPSDFQKDEIRTSGIDYANINNRGTIFIAESGYLMLIKSFQDDTAWDVQRKLVNTYFKAKSIVSEINEQNSMVASILQDFLTQQQEQRLAQETANREIFQMISQNQQTLVNLIASTTHQPYKPPYTKWMDKTFKKVDLIADACGVTRKQMLRTLYLELQDAYGIDLNEHQYEFCYNHGLQNTGIYTMNTIGANPELKTLFDVMVDTYIEQYNLDQSNITAVVSTV